MHDVFLFLLEQSLECSASWTENREKKLIISERSSPRRANCYVSFNNSDEITACFLKWDITLQFRNGLLTAHLTKASNTTWAIALILASTAICL